MESFELTDIKPFKSNALKLSLWIIGLASVLYYSVIAGFFMVFFDENFLEKYSLETLVITNGILSFVFLWFVFLFGLLFYFIQREIYFRKLTDNTKQFETPDLIMHALQNKNVRDNIFEMLDDNKFRGDWKDDIAEIITYVHE